MRLRMLTGLSGPEITLGPGDEHDFPTEEAMRLVAAEYAVPVSPVAAETGALALVAETRDLLAPEQAVPKRRRVRG